MGSGRDFRDALYAQFAQIAAAFSSPKRIEIIDLLAQGERHVEAIARETDLTVANTSRHLQVLKGANLVASRKDGATRVLPPGRSDGPAGLPSAAGAR